MGTLKEPWECAIEWANRNKKRTKGIPLILWPGVIIFSFFIRLPFFKQINEVSNLIPDLACIPLDEQNPKGKEKPNDQKDTKKDHDCNTNPKWKVSQDLFNI